MLRKILFISSVALLFLTIPRPALADVSDQLKQAAGYKDNRQYQQAEAIYQQIITAFPETNDALEAQKQLALIYIAAGTQQQADAAFEKLVADFSKHKGIAEAVWQIAGKYDELKEYDKAYELNQYNVEHFRNDVHAVLSQVEIVKYHFRKGDEPAVDAAVSNFLTAFSGQPTLSKGIYHIARRYDEFKRYDKAIKLHQYNVDHFPGDIHAMWSQVEIIYSRLHDGNEPAADAAVGNLLTVFSKQPTLPKEIWQIGQRYIELKKYDKAFELNQYNIKHFPNDMYAMWSQVEIVYSDIRDGNDAAADEAFNKLLTVFTSQPTLPKEVYQIADAYNRAERNDKAKQLYQKAGQLYQSVIDKNPDSNDELWAKANMVKLNISLGNGAAVGADVNNLIADFNGRPALPQAIFAIGEEYYNKALNAKDEPNLLEAKTKEYYRKALSVWERIIEELPDSNSTIAAHAYYFSAACYRKLGKYEESVKYFQTVVDRWPDYQYGWSAQSLIGECYEKLQKSGKLSASESEPLIEQAYQAVIEKYPDCSLVEYACLKLGDMYLQKGDRDKAAACFELFLKIADPADTRIINTIKVRLERLGGQTK